MTIRNTEKYFCNLEITLFSNYFVFQSTEMNANEQLREVRDVLDRLTRFRYLNGWAAVAAGVVSIIAYAAINLFFNIPWVVDSGNAETEVPLSEILGYCAFLGTLLLVATLICGSIVIISLPRDLTGTAMRNLLKLIGVFGVYILCGAAVLWAVIQGSETVTLGLLRSIPPMMCIFYGLAQFHAAHFSLHTLRILGIIMLLCGFTGVFFPLLGWFTWAVAFGPGHIVTGIVVLKNREH